MIKISLLSLLLWGMAIQITLAQGGSSCSLAAEVSQGINISNNFEGDQWFAYTAKSNGIITISSCGMTDANTYVEIYDDCDSEPFIFSDDFNNEQSEVSFEAIAGLSYLINWKGDKTAMKYEWTLEETSVLEGETCGSPIIVYSGDNENYNPTNKYRWYQFTASRDGKVTVSSTGDNTDSCRVAIFDDCSYTSYLNNDESWNASKIAFDAQEGQSYLICWQNGAASDSIEWTIEESDWEKGERCSDPIDIDVSENNETDHEDATDKWYRFIPQNDGEMSVSSVLMTTEDTYLEVYEGCGEAPVVYSDDASDLQSEVTMNVTGGKAYYIKWDKLFRPKAYTWSLISDTSTSTDLDDENNVAVEVYPNPTTGIVHVNLSKFESSTVYAKILNAAGAVKGMKQLTGGAVETLDISGLKTGVYHIVFSDLVSQSVVRLVKE